MCIFILITLQEQEGVLVQINKLEQTYYIFRGVQLLFLLQLNLFHFLHVSDSHHQCDSR